MNAASRADRKSGDAQVAAHPRSPLISLLMRSDFSRRSENHELLAPSASDHAWFRWREKKHQRRRSTLEAECLAGFNQPADLSTYRRGNSVRTTRATALGRRRLGTPSCRVCASGQFRLRRVSSGVVRSGDSVRIDEYSRFGAVGKGSVGADGNLIGLLEL